jgi:purine-binding chemotaxis protein CheW
MTNQDAADNKAAVRTSGGKNVSEGGKFLTFFLAGEEYGLEILKVHEIIGMMPITSVPRTPRFIKGVINLRGKVIPVVDLRLKLDMDSTEHTEETCIIVVQSYDLEIGVIVDKVSEVLDISGDHIEETPAFGTDVKSDYILGIGKSEGGIKLLLDIDKVLSMGEIASLSSAAEADEMSMIGKSEDELSSEMRIESKAA